MKVTNIKNKVINIGASMVLPDESIEISDDYRNNGVIRKLEKMGFIRIEEDETDTANAEDTDDKTEQSAAEQTATETKKQTAAEKKAAAAKKAAEKSAETAAAEEASAE